ncbi:MAG: TolC family protein [Gemmatimonadaceae bacterium]|nr:TolC family protein [Gemmatimonadaceae bacterium]MCW5826049.1 TolC family protein [Gemmatimonadaceae bacterium]
MTPFARLGLAAVMLASALPMTALVAQDDSLRLPALLAAMQRQDRRAAQLPLLDAQSALRTRNLSREQLPGVSALASGQYVSDVPAIGGVPMVPYQQYDAYVTVRQRLFDPSRRPRAELERAQFDEAEAQVRGRLWQQRAQVNDAFFTLLALDAERRTLEATIADLETHRRLAATRLAAGAALAGDVALLDAELLRRRQTLDDIDATREATRAVLASLTGVGIAEPARLALPDLEAPAAEARRALDTLRARPEYDAFTGSREALAARASQARRSDLPRVSAFARSGYGRPGINPLARDFQSYWIAGVQLEWSPTLWGASARDAEVQRLQQEIVASEEAQFSEQLRRAVQRDLAAMDRLQRSLASDDAIIALHERVTLEARRRFAEGGVTAAELVDRETALMGARSARDLHRVQLAEAQARFLTTVGQEIK